jgi:four helix bundle protein
VDEDRKNIIFLVSCELSIVNLSPILTLRLCLIKSFFMFLQLAQPKLNVFQSSQSLAVECYRVTKVFPNDEKFAMIQQIRRAALSVHFNIAEGCSRKSVKERNRYLEIARGSVIKIDTAFDIAQRLSYTTLEKLQKLGDTLINTFKLLSGMIKQNIIHN